MHGTKRHPKLAKALAPDMKKRKSHLPEWVIGKAMMEKAMNWFERREWRSRI